MIWRKYASWITVVTFALLLTPEIIPRGVPPLPLPPTSFPVTVQVGFFAWEWSDEIWSAHQKDPSLPPDKYSEIRVWGHFDPIDGPNAREFDIVADVANTSNLPQGPLKITISYQWKTGPVGNSKAAKWESPVKLQSEPQLQLGPVETRKIIVKDFSLQTKFDQLPYRHWTWALKVIVRIEAVGKAPYSGETQTTLLRVEHILPIIPTD